MSFQEELRISSVYSVGGGNAFTVPPSKLAFLWMLSFSLADMADIYGFMN